MKTEFSRQIAVKQSNNTCRYFFPKGGELFHESGGTDTTKLILAFRNFPYRNHSLISLVFSLEGRAWQEPEPSIVTGMALAHCILGKFLGVVCHCSYRNRK